MGFSVISVKPRVRWLHGIYDDSIDVEEKAMM